MSEVTESSTPTARPVRGWQAFILPVAVIALALAFGWHWQQTRSESAALHEELARRLRDSDTDSRDARLLARQAQETVREMQARLGQVEAKLAESQSQQVALEALYQELSRGRDEWTVAEIEQILAIASQQLQLAGNVNAALVALQTADARLARADRPQFLPLRKALGRDIERLKSAPSVDVVGMALKLDQVIAAVDTLPFPSDQPVAQPPRAEPAVPQGGNFWSRLGSGLWDELRQLVQVRNLERQEAPLIAPDQAYFLRENLRLRLLNARVALLERNQTLFRSDVGAALAWINRYFDPRSRQSAVAAEALKQLASSGISIELPEISESLSAVRGFKAATSKAAR